MKYIIFLTVFLFGSFFITQKILANNNDVIINEIGAYPTSTHEWIEIWNKGGESIDIKDWKFWENSTNHSLKSATSSDSVISPGEYGAIVQNSDIFLKDYPEFVGSIFDSSWTSLNEGGEEIGLKDGQGNFVEKFVYLPTTKFSLERLNSTLNDYTSLNWQENIDSNSVGFKNKNNLPVNVVTGTLNLPTTTVSVSTTVSSADIPPAIFVSNNIFDWQFIKLNEIISDPENGNEQVELFNDSSSTLSVSGGSICDYTQDNCKILDDNIFGHNWLIIDLLTNRYLNNTSDNLFLKDQNNNVIDKIVYGENLSAPKSGQSLIRKVDGEDSDDDSDWAITDKITLGASNELVINDPPVRSAVGSQSFLGSGSSNTTTKSSVSTEKTSKIIPKTTKIEEKDSVKIVWELDWPYGLDIGEQGIFNARGTADPRGGEINFIWNFGDNTTDTGHLLGHQYATSGVYLVSISASSTSGTFGKKEFRVYVGQDFSVALSDIRISNWQINNQNDLPEYIELKNNLDKKQNISGWKIKNKGGKEYEFPENTIINPSSTLKFFRAVTHLNFDKDEDSIRLTSPNDQVVNTILWKIEKEKIKIKKPLPIGSKKIRQSFNGIVTVEPGVFGTQFFYITDGRSGMQVYQYKKDFPEVKIGDYIQIYGEISQIDNIKRIKIQNKNDIDILSTGNTAIALSVSPRDFTEDIFGILVKLSGEITEIKSNYLYLDDGEAETLVYLYKGTNINTSNFKEGDKIEATGLLDKNKSGWRVLPRNDSDIRVVAHSRSEVLSGNRVGSEGKNEATQNYLTATAGGLTALLFGLLAKTRGAAIMSVAKKIVSIAIKAIRRG